MLSPELHNYMYIYIYHGNVNYCLWVPQGQGMFELRGYLITEIIIPGENWCVCGFVAHQILV